MSVILARTIIHIIHKVRESIQEEVEVAKLVYAAYVRHQLMMLCCAWLGVVYS